jgi:acetyl-CoA carboxylase biotin carboxyl carrier protein
MTEVRSEITGTVWQVCVTIGDPVVMGDTLSILESMKMEIPVESPVSGLVTRVAVQSGDPVREGDVIAVVD